MFKKWSSDGAGTQERSNNISSDIRPAAEPKRTNMILKGSKLTGDINITNDLEMSGDVDGNISSLQDSNIVLKGTCRGNVETKDGSVNIEGSLDGGNIVAGNEVRITGKFNGGEIKAKNKIYVDGEFNGRLEANEIEVGSNAFGKGELHYKDFISIAKGAKINVQIGQLQPELKLVDKNREMETTGPHAAKGELKEAKLGN